MAKQILASVLLLSISLAQLSFPVNANFCSCDLTQNTNLQYSGTNNTGAIESNTNCRLTTSNCHFNLRSNGDMQITENDSNVDCTSNTQFTIVGHNNRIVARSNTNSHFSGSGNQWENHSNSGTTLTSTNSVMELRSNIGTNNIQSEGDNVIATSNTGLTYRCQNSVMELRSNTDSNIQANHGNLVATSNTRLRVTGSNFRTIIRSTTDHTFHGSGQSRVGNQLQISAEANSRRNKREIGVVASPKVTIHFVDKAFVDGHNYKIGKFAFTMKPADNDSYEITMSNGTLINGLMEQRIFNENEALLTMTRNGRKHNLRIKGDLVTSTPGQGITLYPKHPNSI